MNSRQGQFDFTSFWDREAFGEANGNFAASSFDPFAGRHFDSPYDPWDGYPYSRRGGSSQMRPSQPPPDFTTSGRCLNVGPPLDPRSSTSPPEFVSRGPVVDDYDDDDNEEARNWPPPPAPSNSSSRPTGRETDPEVLRRRQKQIDYGKSSDSYARYAAVVPRDQRAGWMPRTPDKLRRTSRRSFDGQVRLWKIAVHDWNREYGGGGGCGGGSESDAAPSSLEYEETTSSDSSAAARDDPPQLEPDGAVVSRRHKQIAFWRTTEAYVRYATTVPVGERTPEMPQTPNIFQRSTKRAFDDEVRSWKAAVRSWNKDYERGGGGGGRPQSACPFENDPWPLEPLNRSTPSQLH